MHESYQLILYKALNVHERIRIPNHTPSSTLKIPTRFHKLSQRKTDSRCLFHLNLLRQNDINFT